MPRYQSWDIVVVPFPFTDQRTTKVRPAVIVSTERLSRHTGKYVLAMITSASNAKQYGDVVTTDFTTTGLPAPSMVRPSKLAVVEEADLYKRVGTLAHSDRAQVTTRLREFLAIDFV